MLILLEGLVMAFWLLLICVKGIANGPVGLVNFYEQDVQERAVELGLTTAERIKKTARNTGLALFLPLVTAVPAAVCLLNDAAGFRDRFLQMTAIYLIMGLFDRLFIDGYWVGRPTSRRRPRCGSGSAPWPASRYWRRRWRACCSCWVCER